MTLVECALQLLAAAPSARLLLAAPKNFSADQLVVKLALAGMRPRELLSLNDPRRCVHDHVWVGRGGWEGGGREEGQDLPAACAVWPQACMGSQNTFAPQMLAYMHVHVCAGAWWTRWRTRCRTAASMTRWARLRCPRRRTCSARVWW